jgi:hypothetical protein
MRATQTKRIAVKYFIANNSSENCPGIIPSRKESTEIFRPEIN